MTRGIVAAADGLFRLRRVLPPARARRGIVNHLVEPHEVVDTARALADRICRNAPFAVRERLVIARDALQIDEEQAWARSAAAMQRVRGSADAAEDVRAFVDERPARWTGR